MTRTAQAAGHDKLIGFDMGGTSTDVSHFAGQFERSFETETAGVRMRAQMMDIHTVAAGGDSICSYREGRLQVGPESAGADPGPACYRRGGPITVTDCNVLLGSLSPDYFPHVFGPNGDQALDIAAVKAKLKDLAGRIPTEQSIEDLASGFLEISVQNMANAIKKISVERGHDLTAYTLQGFGGAGGQHACLVAQALGMTRVFIHPFAGVLSAYGMGLADITAQREGQLDCALDNHAKVDAMLAKLKVEAEEEVAAQGINAPQLNITAHLRYEGSHQALEVPFGAQGEMQRAFENAHQARFGFVSKGRNIQYEMISAEAIGAAGATSQLKPQFGTGQAKGQVQLYRDGWQTAPVFHRDDLQQGQTITGPAIILEKTGTNVIEPHWQAAQDTQGNLILTHIGQAARNIASTQVDPILLEVMSNRFMSIADQMGATLANTSWSVNIKEPFDFSCAMFDANGDLWRMPRMCLCIWGQCRIVSKP